MKKQSIQILLAVAGIGVAVYVYLQSKKKKQVASPADKPGSPFYTATGAASPAALSSGAGQSATQSLQNRRTGTAQNPGGTKPDVWGQAAGAVGSLLGGLFGKNKNSGASGGGSKLGSGLGSSYKGPGSLSGGAQNSGSDISKVKGGDLSDEFGENPGQFRAMEGEYGTENDPLNPNYEHSDYVPDYSGGNSVDFSGGDNTGEPSGDFAGYGGNDGYGDYGGGGDLAGDFEGGGNSNADFESD